MTQFEKRLDNLNEIKDKLLKYIKDKFWDIFGTQLMNVLLIIKTQYKYYLRHKTK